MQADRHDIHYTCFYAHYACKQHIISKVGETCIAKSDYGKNITSELICITDQLISRYRYTRNLLFVCRLLNDAVLIVLLYKMKRKMITNDVQVNI